MPLQASRARAGKGSRARKGNKNPKRDKSGITSPSRDFGNDTTIKQASTPLFPARTTRRLRYFESVTASMTAGALTAYVFSANGIYDPNITGGGHQCMGFDQIMLSYNHYIVTHAKITVTATNGASTPTFCCIAVSPSATPLSTIQQLVEYGGNTIETLESKAISGQTRVLQNAVDIKKIQGVQNVVDDPSLRGDAASNPVEQTYFIVYVWNTQGSSGSVYFDVIIDFVSIFNEPRVLPQSIQHAMKMLIAGESKTCGGHPVLL